ncbi:MAG: ABC transporter permease [Bacteroidia bacterium]|nr:MAG: ABC transporter permease [Bacteroidia bacterium]
MKTLVCFIKTLKENIRDWKILILAIVFAPFFIYMMYIYMGDSGSVAYNIVLINNDRDGVFSNELIGELEKIKTEDGKSFLKITAISDSTAAKDMIRNKDADLLVTIPAGFSDSFSMFIASGNGSLLPIKNYGDQANLKYMVAASFIDYTAISYICLKTGIEIPFNVEYEYAGRGKSLKEFDLYVPALLVLSIIMMLFTAGASIVREVEKDTITRLSLSKLKSTEFMTALTLNQIIIGLICLFLTLLAAFSVGYRTSGSIPLLLLVGALTCFSVVSISIITSSFIKTMFGLLTLGCFPFFILMFFSDCFLPLPKINMFNLAGHQVYVNDILPTATATRAFNKILNYDSGFSDVAFEIIWILALSLVYFFIGVWLFRKKYKY